jgi:hypothetical protein
MVFFFVEKCGSDEYTIYMGKEKMENEQLIKFAWPEDVWFHVDNFSSAHVYLRLPPGTTLKSIPAEVIKDCAVFVKHNSIDGSKEKKVRVVYTMATNLKKTASMVDGQVGFKDEKQVIKIEVEKDNAIYNRIVKTKVEMETQKFQEEREERDKRQRELDRKAKKKAEEEERQKKEQQKKDAEARSYANVLTEENMTSNTDLGVSAKQYEEDFM